MKITKITKIKNHRVFQNFAWPADLPTFARYNVIYGWNGSGKTTLSSLFRSIEHHEPITGGPFEIELDNNSVIDDANFGTAMLPNIRVFNRDFVNKTITAIQKDCVDPISIFIGEKKLEDLKLLEAAKKDSVVCAETLSSVLASLSSEEKALSTFLTKGAKTVKDGLLQFNAARYVNYNKQDFEQTLKTIKHQAEQVVPLDKSALTNLQTKASQRPKATISFSLPTLPNLDRLREQVSHILGESIVSRTIEELTRNPKLSDWVQTGLSLHSGENHSETCHFCGNPLSSARKEQLEAHFNDSFKTIQKQINSLLSAINQYQAWLTETRNQLPHSSQFYDDLALQCEAICLRINENSMKLHGRLQLYAEYLRKKSENLFQPQNCDLTKDDDDEVSTPLQMSFNDLTALVQQNTLKTNTLDADRNAAVRALERNMVLNWIEEYDNHLASIEEKHNELNKLRARQDSLTKAIKSLERYLIETSRAADELTQDLHAYLGRNEISFSVTDGQPGYRLLRNGHPATHLSEGEQSAIAFLYFLKTLSDNSFSLDKGIVVIDDPVSSLDSNSLFTAFSFMKQRVENCEQLFVLSHNFVFFRQVSNWFHHMKRQNKDDCGKRPARFYMLQAKGIGTSRHSDIMRIDPLLEEFESEYHYLFKRIYELVSTECVELSSFYEAPNIARRVLEIFLAYQAPCHAGGLYDQLSAIKFDAVKKTVILRLLNACSHGEGIRDPEHDPTALSEAKQALQYVLDLIQAYNQSHYDGMVALIQSSSAKQSQST